MLQSSQPLLGVVTLQLGAGIWKYFVTVLVGDYPQKEDAQI